MTFIARFRLPREHPPKKIYLHSSGADVYMGLFQTSAQGAIAHVTGALDQLPELQGMFHYVIAIAWGDNGDKMVDCFGFSGIRAWPGNPDVSTWVLKNGVYQQRTRITPKDTMCEDSIILLGREAELRRRSHSLDSFLISVPHFFEEEGIKLDDYLLPSREAAEVIGIRILRISLIALNNFIR